MPTTAPSPAPAAEAVDGAREQVLAALRTALPHANIEAAARCAERLLDVVPDRERLHRNRVLVAFGGGKDSAYTVAFVRAMQLLLARATGTTFRMRVATHRHAGMPRAVLRNIDHVYRALALLDDPDCELVLVDGDEVLPFDADLPLREHVVRRNRLDVLMAGHRTMGDGRPTFCNACNLGFANSLGLAATHDGGADVLVTGDSRDEQRQYAAWINRLARQVAPRRAGSRPPTHPRRGTAALLSRLDTIATSYFSEINGSGSAARRVHADVPPQLTFFSIYSETRYDAGDHMDLLVGLLGFEFDDLAFSFTESDCGNPTLMAHLRALKTEHVFGRTYADGLAEYVTFALDLMRRKDFPEHLVEHMRRRYAGGAAVARMRRVAEDYARETFGLTPQQCVCMVWSPFSGGGAALEAYLAAERPSLHGRADEIRALLSEPDREPLDQGLVEELTRVSGLSLTDLRALYAGPRRTGRERGGVVAAVLDGDPHKTVVRTRHSADGPDTFEQISGR